MPSPTAYSMAKVMTGLYNYVTADSNYNTAMGGTAILAGRIYYGHVERDTALPFTAIDVISSVDTDTMDKNGYDFRVQFTIYDDAEAGPMAVMDHMDKLRGRLHRQRPTVAVHNQMTVSEDTVRGPFREDDAWRIDADYIVRGYENAIV